MLSTWRHGVDTTGVLEASNAQAMAATAPDGESTLGLLERWGSITLVWRFRGFTYARRL